MSTTEEKKQGHHDLWTWCGRNPEKLKRDWTGYHKYDFEDYTSTYCFACGEAESDCYYCPIDWNSQEDCWDKNTLYYLWWDYYDIFKNYIRKDKSEEDIQNILFKRSVLAFIIANKWR